MSDASDDDPPADGDGRVGSRPDSLAGGAACLTDLGPGETAWRRLGEVEVGLDPEGVVVHRPTQKAYVACSRSNAVAVVDLATMSKIAEIPVGTEPIDIVADDPTGLIITADARSNQLSVIDPARSDAVLTTIPVGFYPSGLGIDVASRRVYAGNAGGASVSVVDVDALEVVATVPAEFGAGAVAVDDRRHRAYCVNFLAASVTVIDTDSLEPVGRIEVGAGPCAVAVNPAGREVYVVNSIAGTLARIDADTQTITGTIKAGQAPVGLAAGPAGDRMYVANRGEGTVSVLGVEGGEWYRIPVGAAPGGVAVHPDQHRRILIANAGSGTLTVAEDLVTTGGAGALAPVPTHPLVGTRLPEFALPALRTGETRTSREWSERKYILNFFASW
jgi:YVTN family beta-propeller protein